MLFSQLPVNKGKSEVKQHLFLKFFLNCKGLERKTIFVILPQLETYLSMFYSLVLLIKQSIHMLSVYGVIFHLLIAYDHSLSDGYKWHNLHFTLGHSLSSGSIDSYVFFGDRIIIGFCTPFG